MSPRACVFLAALATTVVVAPVARADSIGPSGCLCGVTGVTCDRAGPNYDQPGVCTDSQCPGHTEDGGIGETYCLLCVSSGGGPTASGHDSSCGGGVTQDGGSGSGGSGGGCALTPLQRDGATGFAMLALGVGALVWGRRRRS
ncbi:MAG: hypothetical protein ACRELB_02835 [Polyangiaceae bacterium]